jgi:hypothetical protein
MKNALVKNLIFIEVGCAAAQPPPIDRQTPPNTFSGVKNTFKNLVITQAEIRFSRLANHNRILRVVIHALGEGVVHRLRLPRWHSAQVDESDWFH